MLLFFTLSGVWLDVAAFCLSPIFLLCALFLGKNGKCNFYLITLDEKTTLNMTEAVRQWLKSFVNTNWTWSLNVRVEKWDKTVICNFSIFYLWWWAWNRREVMRLFISHIFLDLCFEKLVVKLTWHYNRDFQWVIGDFEWKVCLNFELFFWQSVKVGSVKFY